MAPEDLRATVPVVEDDEDNRIIYRTVLEHYGYTVLEASDGEAGIRGVREHRPDIVPRDIFMPVVNGHKATQSLKADSATASIPVVALTATAMAEDRRLATEAGRDSYWQSRRSPGGCWPRSGGCWPG